MQKSIAPTLLDVARHAGVNKVTASIVLSGGSGNTRVAETTRQRILASARELQYQPNAVARSLRRRHTHIIGFYMSGSLDTRNPFLAEIISGLHAGCEEHHRDFLIHGAIRGRAIDDIVAELLNGKVDGLALHVSTDDALVARLAASPLPVIALANPVPALPSVVADEVAGGRLLVEHLALGGRRSLFYIGSPFPLSSAIRRAEAFEVAAQQHGLLLLESRADDPESTGLPAVEEFLALPASRRPSAIACWNDALAYRVVEALRARRIRIPEQVAVVGFDGSRSAIPAAYTLTTVRAPWRQVAQTAVSLLIAQQAGQPPPPETMLPVEFVHGDTA